MLLAVSIFIFSLFLIIFRPFSLNIAIGAIFGALLAIVFGVVNFGDILRVWEIVWDPTLCFIGIVIFSLSLDRIGFFEWMAIKIIKISKGSGVLMFVYSLLLAGAVSALFANDGAILILTPILFSKMKILDLDKKTLIAFLVAGGFISDSASLPFVFSNLTNILTAHFFHIGFVEYFVFMIIPFFVSLFFSILILFFIFKKDIPKKVDISSLPNEDAVLKDRRLFYISWIFLFFLLVSYVISDLFEVPLAFFSLGGAFLFLFICYLVANILPKDIIKQTPWDILWFSLGLYIVVYGLKNVGLSDILHTFLKEISSLEDLSIFVVGFVSAFLSAFMNNLPSIMIMNISLVGLKKILIFANIIGSNIGPKLTPFGSLSTLLWLGILKKRGIQIGYFEYIKLHFLLTLLVLFFVLSSLLIFKGC